MQLGPAQNFAYYAFEQLYSAQKAIAIDYIDSVRSLYNLCYSYLLIMLKIMSITTAIMSQFIHSFIVIINDCISISGQAPACCVLHHAMLQRSYIILHIVLSYYMLMRKLVAHSASSQHDYYITKKNCYIKSDDQMSIYKSTIIMTFNRLHACMCTNHFVVTLCVYTSIYQKSL